MQLDDAFLLQLLVELQAAESPWHSIEIFADELLLDEPKLLFHLELLIDRNYVTHRPADAGNRESGARTDVAADPWLFSRTSLLRLTAQGHEFADDALARAQWQAARKQVDKVRHKPVPYVNADAERSMMGLDEIQIVFRIDAE